MTEKQLFWVVGTSFFFFLIDILVAERVLVDFPQN